MRATYSIFLIITCVAFSFSHAAGISYQGRIFKPDGQPLESTSVMFRMQVRSPGSENCLLFEEIQTINMTSSSGVFSLTLNDGTGSRVDTPSYTFERIFANRDVMTLDAARCTTGTTYTPAATDSRKFIVYFKDETMSTYEPLPILTLNNVPQAMYALESQKVGTFATTNLLRAVDGSGNPVTAPAFDPTQLTNLNNLIAGTSTQYATAANFTSVQTFAKTTLPTCGAGEFLKGNGTALSCVTGNNSSSYSSITGATGINTIDNTNYAQTWDWSTATTQNPMSMSANALTTGSLLKLTTSSGSLNSTNGLLNVANSSASTTGILARFQSNSTAGSGLTVLANGNVGIGTAAPASKLNISDTITTASGFNSSLNIATSGNPSASSGATDRAANIAIDKIGAQSATTAVAVNGYSTNSGAGALTNLVGGYFGADTSSGAGLVTNILGIDVDGSDGGSGTATNVWGGRFTSTVNGSRTNVYGLESRIERVYTAGTVASAYGIKSYINNDYSSGITNAYGLHLKIHNTSGSTAGMTNAYGVYIDGIDANTASFGVYQSSASNKNYFAGNVGIGVNPSYPLDVRGNAFVGSDSTGQITLQQSSANATGPTLYIQKSRGTISTPTYAADGDILGTILFGNHSQSAGATITSTAVGAHSTGPLRSGGKLEFSTTPTGTNTLTTRMTISDSGSVKVSGQLATGSQTIAGGTTAIDWNNGNTISTDYNCGGQFNFANLMDGGTYTLVVTDASTTLCDFSTTTTGTNAGTVSYRFRPTNGVRVASTHTIYTLMRIGSVVYVSWASGF
jgi:hypothetical protein